MSLLSDKALAKYLEEINWEYSDNTIYKEFVLKEFSDAISFVVKIGMLAEKADHHPDIKVFSWNKVKVELTTHDQGGITEKDISLAQQIEKL